MAEDEKTPQPAGSRRMEILQQSLANKQAAFDERLQAHFDDVKSANGQPLNDKRNGRQTFDRWERQNDALRSMQESIEKTQRAIEREQHKIDKVARAQIPEYLKPLLESGEISQWRKYPNRFFVKGVEKARIIWFEDKQAFGYSHIQGMPPEQRPLFKATYDKIRALHQQAQEKSPEPAQAAELPRPAMEQSIKNEAAATADKDGGNPAVTLEQITGKSFGDFIGADYSPLQSKRKRQSRVYRQEGLSEEKKLEALQALQLTEQKLRRLRMNVFDFEKAVDAYLNGSMTAAEMSAHSGGFSKAAEQIIAAVSAHKAEQAASNTVMPSENTPVVADSGFKPGTVLQHQNRHIRDVYLVVGREKNGDRYLLLGEDPVRTPVLREHTAEGLEPAPALAYQASLVYENTDAAKAYRLFERNSEPYRAAYELIDKADFFVPFGQSVPVAEKQPAERTPAEKFQAAKESYMKQTPTLPPAKQERRRLLESQLENLIRGLPEQTQMQARTNFYTSQVAEQTRQAQYPAAPEQQGEISFDR